LPTIIASFAGFFTTFETSNDNPKLNTLVNEKNPVLRSILRFLAELKNRKTIFAQNKEN